MEMESTINMRTDSTDNNAVDLLAITEAAVQALGKPRFNRTVDVRCVDYMGAVKLGPKHPQVHVYSNLAGEDSGAMDLNHSDGYPLDSESINASARSISDSSDRSSVLAGSAFLRGTAKPVKISTKRLTEIKSPFDEPVVTQTSSVAHHQSDPARLHNSALNDGGLNNNVNANPKTTEYPAEKFKDLCKQGDGQTVIRGVEDRLGDGMLGSGKSLPSESVQLLDSGYMTQPVTVTKEMQQQMLRTSETEEGGWTANQQADDTLSSVEAFLVSPQGTILMFNVDLFNLKGACIFVKLK